MGKGDKKTKKGKIFMGSYGTSRKRVRMKYNSATAGLEPNPADTKGGSSRGRSGNDNNNNKS